MAAKKKVPETDSVDVVRRRIPFKTKELYLLPEEGQHVAVLADNYFDDANAATFEYKTFLSIVADAQLHYTSANEEFLKLQNDHADPASAVREAVAARTDIDASRKPELSDLFALWLRRATWGRFHLTMSNKPSNSSWIGWPWEHEVVLPKVLTSFNGRVRIVKSIDEVPAEIKRELVLE
jgi:hypothetical protein